MLEIINSKKADTKTVEIGGKARGLLFFEKNNFLTPSFYILNFDILSAIINGSIDLNDVLKKWIEVNQIAEDALWAVRSSADNEDGTKKSFAGFFTTEINVTTPHLKNAIKKVLGSYSNIKDQEYTSQKKVEFGIIIQEMIRSEYSGVIFSHNPYNIKDDTIHISAIPGIGENLVSGKENGFSITYANKKYSFSNTNIQFCGQYYSNGLIDLHKNSEEIKKELKPFLTRLVKGTSKLYHLKNYPVDIEFTIANGIVYWLQVRPITTGKEEPMVWDNTASEGNYPGKTLPLSISMVTNSFYRAYKSMALFLKMPKKQMASNELLLSQVQVVVIF